jgi:hypothetical protein
MSVRFRARSSSLGLLLATLVGVCACGGSTGKQPIDLSNLRDGQTRLDDALHNLGPPAMRYEKGQILTYRVGTDGKVYFLEIGPASATWFYHPVSSEYSLVLEFGTDGLLRRHTLVHVGEPSL